jgi:hypothetical protein
VGNTRSATVSYNVVYGVCALYDQSGAKKAGAALPIKLQLCDAAQKDVSAAAIAVRALAVDGTVTPADEGKSNPGGLFRYDSSLGPTGGYIFNLKTTGLAPGTHSLSFNVGGDPTVHRVQFVLR